MGRLGLPEGAFFQVLIEFALHNISADLQQKRNTGTMIKLIKSYLTWISTLSIGGQIIVAVLTLVTLWFLFKILLVIGVFLFVGIMMLIAG